MFGLSGEHLLVILVILLIFGPKRLPDLGHSIGRTMKNFKDAMSGNHEEKAAALPAQPASPPQGTASTSTQAAAPQAEVAEPRV